jgi:hypothetical protein
MLLFGHHQAKAATAKHILGDVNHVRISLSLCYRFQNTVIQVFVATAKVNHPDRSITDSYCNVSNLQRACA